MEEVRSNLKPRIRRDINISEAPTAINPPTLTEMSTLVESAPINIMYCNTDLVIQYANPQSIETLEKLEKHLPIAVRDVVGANIDIFHKSPSHQRRLLSNEKNLPIHSVIVLGPEKLDLLITAMHDETGKFSGAMVTWSVITEKLVLEKKVEDAALLLAALSKSQATIEFGMDGIVASANENFLKTLGYSLLEIQGKHHSMFCSPKYTSSNEYREFWSKLNRGEFEMGQFMRVAKDGREVWIQASYNPVFDGNGKVCKVVKYAVEVTKAVAEKKNLVATLTETSAQLGAAAEELSATATQMSKNSSDTSEQSTSAAAASEEVSKGVQTVATNTEEMVASIKEIARSSSDAASMSKEAMQRASDTNAMINQLGASSQEIGNVIKVISSIAQQTNLLALNATIEAARAGEAGKGFAVVANEVKELAKQTAKATEEITTKIGAIQGDSKNAVGAIGAIAEVIEKLNGISVSIAAAVEEQTATTNEVSRVVQESSKGVESISSTVKAVASAANQSSEGAAQTLTAAESLSNLATKLADLVKRIEI